MKLIHAVYENGVFRPTEPIDLPEKTEVEIEARVVAPLPGPRPEGPPPDAMDESLARIYEVLGKRHHSGHSDTALRHNEHQP